MRLGNFKQHRVVVDNYDVTDAVIGFKIWHDITNPTWSAQVFFMDSTNLLNTIPILSGSKMKIMIETKHNVSTDMKKEYEFVIYRIDDKFMQNQQNLCYTAFCVSQEFVTNMSTKISRNFANTKMTDAIKNVVSETFPLMTVDGASCDNNANLIIPQWTPFNSIGWMLKMSHINNRADFLFFQSEQNKFTCDSILNLFTKVAGSETLKVRPSNIGLDLPTDVYNIFDYSFVHSDASLNMSSGYYGNTLKTFDFRKKEWNVQKYTTSETRNWKGEAFDNASESVVNFKAKAFGVNGNNTSPADDANIWLQSRMASLMNLEQEKLIAQIPGTVGIYAWLGKTINVDLPNQNAMDASATDYKRSGRYLVKAVVHKFDNQTYTNTLELVRRSV